MKESSFKNYYEPFLGGGAVFFALSPSKAYLSDINSDLIATYKSVKERPNSLLSKLKNMEQSKESYYRIRASQTLTQDDLAAKFLYLNRLAFAGMYRVNQHGDFNVPYGGGRRTDILWEQNLLIKASSILQAATLKCASYEAIINRSQEGDLIYCDPTYTVAHNDNAFLRYNEKVFHWSDQKILATLCKEAGKRGVQIVISNAAHPCIAKLYHPYKPILVSRHTCISRRKIGRKRVDEYVFIINGNRTAYKKSLQDE
jgi:DNA adenine methylase